MITTQWIMTIFTGYIEKETIILPILDNFILEESPTRSWRRVYSIILAFLQHHALNVLELKDVSDVAMYFQNIQFSQNFSIDNPQILFKKSFLI